MIGICRRALSGLRTWVSNDRAASLVEYALLVALIALIAFAAVGFLGESTSQGLSEAGSKVGAAN